jgi:RHS repeat-associated protein
VDLPVSRTADGETVYYLQDHAGSVTALTRPDGTLIGRYAYTPFGEVSADPGMPQQPLLWTGREWDETGLYYFRGRYYSDSIGRFLSEDPAGLAVNLNLYLFALNSPVGMRDPFGLDASNLDDDADGDIWGLIGDYKKATGAAGGLLEGATKGLYGGPGGIAATVFDAGNAAGKGDLVGVAAAVGPEAAAAGLGKAVGALGDYVDELGDLTRPMHKDLRPGTVAGLETPDGLRFPGVSGRFGLGQNAPARHPTLQAALDGVQNKSDVHDKCAELNAIDNALKQGSTCGEASSAPARQEATTAADTASPTVPAVRARK